MSLRGPRQAGALGSSPLLCPGAGFAAGLNKYPWAAFLFHHSD